MKTVLSLLLTSVAADNTTSAINKMSNLANNFIFVALFLGYCMCWLLRLDVFAASRSFAYVYANRVSACTPAASSD